MRSSRASRATNEVGAVVVEDGGRNLLAALLRPRGLLVWLVGAGLSVGAAVVLNGWLLLVGLAMTASVYGWSVAASLHDGAFLEAAARPGLQASVADDVRLEVAARCGSSSLSGARRAEHRRLAGMAHRLLGYVEQSPPEARDLMSDVPARLAALVDDFERMALEVGELEISGGDAERLARLQAEMDAVRGAVEAVEERLAALGAGRVDCDEVRRRLTSLRDDVEAVESTVHELKLLE